MFALARHPAWVRAVGPSLDRTAKPAARHVRWVQICCVAATIETAPTDSFGH
jgi:hypothetical protein